MPGYERFLVQIFITLIPVIGLYFSMKDKATKQEKIFLRFFRERYRKSERIQDISQQAA